jgi:DNA-binding MarR family transcriptional regulator
MRRHGLHLGQNYLLAVLWERDGSTPGEIAAALNVTTPTELLSDPTGGPPST